MSVKVETVYINTEFNKNNDKTVKKVIKKAVSMYGQGHKYSVYLTFCDDEHIKKLNNEFRDINSTTDVLSFPMIEFDRPMNLECIDFINDINYMNKCIELGDIVISIPSAKRQAEEYVHSLEREIAYLCVHSMMHLFGHDHMDSSEKKAMRENEESVLMSLEIDREMKE